MRAEVGDTLVVHGRKVGSADERCEVLEVRGDNGGPPFLVRHADGHEGLLVPGPETSVTHTGGATRTDD